ncbi:hypothetical protein FPT15_25255 [Pseudomonas sp. RGB]|nr:hypothetical protein FPT15_25255 [Pseudomonas sp. RGB]
MIRHLLTNVGAGLPAMQTPRSISYTEVMLSQASQLPHFDFHLPQDQRYAVAIPSRSVRHSGAPISNSRQISGRRS